MVYQQGNAIRLQRGGVITSTNAHRVCKARLQRFYQKNASMEEGEKPTKIDTRPTTPTVRSCQSHRIEVNIFVEEKQALMQPLHQKLAPPQSILHMPIWWISPTIWNCTKNRWDFRRRKGGLVQYGEAIRGRQSSFCMQVKWWRSTRVYYHYLSHHLSKRG